MKRIFAIISFIIIITLIACTGCYIGPEDCYCQGLWNNKTCNLPVDSQRFGSCLTNFFRYCSPLDCPDRDEYYMGGDIRYITEEDYTYEGYARVYEDDGFFDTQKFYYSAVINFPKRAYDVTFYIYIMCDDGVLIERTEYRQSVIGEITLGKSGLKSDIYYKNGSLSLKIIVTGYLGA